MVSVFDLFMRILFVGMFLAVLILIRYIGIRIYGASPGEMRRRLREKSVSMFRYSFSPLLGRYIGFRGRIGFRYEVINVSAASMVFASIIGITVSLLGLVFPGKPLLMVKAIPLDFIYAFLLFFAGGFIFALYHYWLIKSERVEEV